MNASVKEACDELSGWRYLSIAILIRAVEDYLTGYAYMYNRFGDKIPSRDYFRHRWTVPEVTWYYTALNYLDRPEVQELYSVGTYQTIFNAIIERKKQITDAIDNGEGYAKYLTFTMKNKGVFKYE